MSSDREALYLRIQNSELNWYLQKLQHKNREISKSKSKVHYPKTRRGEGAPQHSQEWVRI